MNDPRATLMGIAYGMQGSGWQGGCEELWYRQYPQLAQQLIDEMAKPPDQKNERFIQYLNNIKTRLCAESQRRPSHASPGAMGEMSSPGMSSLSGPAEERRQQCIKAGGHWDPVTATCYPGLKYVSSGGGNGPSFSGPLDSGPSTPRFTTTGTGGSGGAANS